MQTWEDIQKKTDIIYGLEVRKRREQLRISQRKLAKKIGVKQNTLIRYELGLDPCPKPIRNRIEEVLGPIETVPDSEKEIADCLRADAADATVSSVGSRKRRSPQTNENHKTMALEFGLEVMRARMRLGLTLREFSKLLGVNDSTLSKYERGVMLPRPAAMVGLRKILRQLADGADEGLPGTDSRPDVRESVALHEEAAADYDPAPVFEGSSVPLPPDEQQTPQELRPFGKYQELLNRITGRQNILCEKGLVQLSDDAFFRLCCYMKDLLGNRDNLDVRFAGIDD